MNGLSVSVKELGHFREVQGLQDQGGGLVTVINTDGSVVSVQPDGSVQTRPAGTAGGYELAQKDLPRLWFKWGVLLYREGLAQ